MGIRQASHSATIWRARRRIFARRIGPPVSTRPLDERRRMPRGRELAGYRPGPPSDRTGHLAFRIFSASPAVNYLAAEGLAGAWGRRFRLPTIFLRLLRESPTSRRRTALRRPCPAR